MTCIPSHFWGGPGDAPRHSNLAAELLGYIVARRYGQSYATLVRSKIQHPLGMANGASADDPKLVVQGYDAHHVPMPMTSQPAVLAAGGLRVSPQDMAKFLAAELAQTDPAIQMSQRTAWGSVDTGAVGFTWNIGRNVEGTLKLNMSGGTSGSASYVEIYPERGYGVVLLANRSGETEGLLYGLADALFATNEGTPALDALKNVLEQNRYTQVDTALRRVRKRFPNLTLSQAFVNNWGGGLLGSDPKTALALFAYNAHRWPRSSDAYDSLGDGYAANGKRQAAILAYRRALVLNPENKEATDSLAHLLSASLAK